MRHKTKMAVARVKVSKANRSYRRLKRFFDEMSFFGIAQPINERQEEYFIDRYKRSKCRKEK